MIDELKNYFIKHVTLTNEFINILADFLNEEVTSYSIEPIPTDYILKQYRDGGSLRQLVFNFTSREYYDNSVAQNIENLDFYEKFQEEIETNNKNGVLPKIKGIQSIECLNNGTIQSEENGTGKYAIQMRITYTKEV